MRAESDGCTTHLTAPQTTDHRRPPFTLPEIETLRNLSAVAEMTDGPHN
jgi:hypothetical protein